MGSHSVMPSTMPISKALTISISIQTPLRAELPRHALSLSLQYTILFREKVCKKLFTGYNTELESSLGPCSTETVPSLLLPLCLRHGAMLPFPGQGFSLGGVPSFCPRFSTRCPIGCGKSDSRTGPGGPGPGIFKPAGIPFSILPAQQRSGVAQVQPSPKGKVAAGRMGTP